MKLFFIGAWISAAVLIAISSVIDGEIPLRLVIWGAATFAGWTMLVLAGRN